MMEYVKISTLYGYRKWCLLKIFKIVRFFLKIRKNRRLVVLFENGRKKDRKERYLNVKSGFYYVRIMGGFCFCLVFLCFLNMI